MNTISDLEKFRKQYQPKMPACLKSGIASVTLEKGEPTEPETDREAIKKAFPNTYGLPIINFKTGNGPSTSAKPLKVGVILSGGQAPGGHNVIAGIFDGIKNVHPQSQLIGFLGGPAGLVDGHYELLEQQKIDDFRNTGGFDIIGSGRTKLEEVPQFEKSIQVIHKLGLDAIVVIGGDDSNTNAAILAEYLKSRGETCAVIGVPKTIDGDLKNKHIPASFGFDTAVKSYAELVGNICRDSKSAKKYWHFIKLMGRSASHITLEVGLQTQPNVTLISEEVAEKQLSLDAVVDQICDSITARAAKGKNYGVAIIPEGIIEFIPTIKNLISALNDIMAKNEARLSTLTQVADKVAFTSEFLNEESSRVLNSLPPRIQEQLFLDRDPHGNVQVSRIETEVLLLGLTQNRLKQLASEGKYKGKFSVQNHFFGYEGRCAPPSNFDADYTYSLGYGAVVLINAGATGYMSSVSNVKAKSDLWRAGGIPITMLFNLEQRHGAQKPVIKKALVELDGKPFQRLAENRKKWAEEDCYVYPGPIQYYGPPEVCDMVNKTLALETL